MEPQALTPRDTIAAVATPHGSGGIAVIRVSGPDAICLVERMWKGRPLAECAARTAHLGTVTQEDGSPLDNAVITIFRAPSSFTGEDTVEISLHGSLWIQREVMNRLTSLGARPAGPGEFTQRAFLNGRLDLAQAEAVADLISADNRAAHRLAIRQMSGAFSQKLDALREQLLHFASMLELELDFSEEDVEFADRSQFIQLAEETFDTVKRLADSYARGQVFRDGLPVAIAGAPNAGKSTLLNLLLGNDKAIVSDIPGTTRDVIEDTCEIGGIPVRLFDTAGLRETDDSVERIGIERAEERIRRAAVILWICDATKPLSRQLDAIMPYCRELRDTRHVVLANKFDLVTDSAKRGELHDILNAACGAMEGVCISARTGEGIDQLEKIIGAAAGSDDLSGELIVTNARHHTALAAGAEALTRACEGLRNGLPTDLIAQDVREAIWHIGSVTGAVTTTDILTNIFSRFCIGK